MERAERRHEEYLKREELRLSLLAKWQLPDDEATSKMWRFAWEHGHASGLYEVAMFFDEIAEIAICLEKSVEDKVKKTYNTSA